MSKLDVYLRSIEKFGAAGAVLTSGQAVTLRFPAGDRQATQVTAHDQLVVMVREVAPPSVIDQIDQQRPARFEIESMGIRYGISVAPRPGSWSVSIEPAAAASPPPRQPRAGTAPTVEAGGDMAIERGQYDVGQAVAATAATTGSASGVLDGLTTQARASRATDIFLAAGAPPMVRVAGELSAAERGVIDGETLSRELGVLASNEARAAWTDGGTATFAYSDGAGRVRVTLTRDHRGPGAALRLLHGDPPPLAGLGLGGEVAEWLAGRGLILIAGPSGAGKTTALAALVRALGERRKSVVTFEDPVEIVQPGPSISQRAIGEHVATASAGVAAAMREGADVIAIGAVSSTDAAEAVLEAVAGGHLVLASVTAPSARLALEVVVDLVSADRRGLARAVFGETLLGTIAPVVTRQGSRSFSVFPRGTHEG
ncbi:MAG: ATPase, T2SS/T4P/T4SS family [Kofleriaceae bacterium]|nr:ATPase, T2SS/T4P/T4SS family [Kofleriaceae bacterium]